jgi:hypothetical protein
VTGPQVTPGFGPDGHAELGALAELDESLLEETQTRQLDVHLQTCVDCRDQLGRIRATRALLSALPAEPMPTDVVRRIDAALTDAMQTATVLPATKRRRWFTSPAFAGVAAAVAAVGLASALIVSRDNGSGGSNAEKGGAANTSSTPQHAAGLAAPQNTVKQWQTGANYTPSNISVLVPGILAGTPTPVPSPAGEDASPNTFSGTNTKSAATESYTREQLRSLPNLIACAKILNAGDAVQPLAVDFANFKGKPATIVVIPTHDDPAHVDVWIIQTTCSNDSLMPVYRVPRPS